MRPKYLIYWGCTGKTTRKEWCCFIQRFPFLFRRRAGRICFDMQLLYFYAKFYDMQGHPALYRSFPSWSINFSPQHYFRFLPETGQLSEPESDSILPQVPDGFWGERIYNATAFVSGNGGGKSTIMQYPLRLLVDLVQNLPSPTQAAEDWVIVFEVDGEIIALQNQSILARVPCQLLHARCGVTCLCCGNTKNNTKLNHLHRHLCRTKLLYLTNVLSKADAVFQDEWLIREPDRAKRVLFDASPYALMRQEEKECEAGDDILQKFFCGNRSGCSVFSRRPDSGRC